MITNQTILLLISLLLAQSACAQWVNTGQTVTVTANTQVTVQGSFLNEGELANQGMLLVRGDWYNPHGYTGKGTVVFNGEGKQVVDHHGQGFYHLMLDGEGEKVFVSPAVISGELYLNEGILTPAAAAVLLIKDEAYVSEGNRHSYVNGRLFHAGTGEKYYPIGKNGSFKPVILNAAGDMPVVGLELFEPNPYQLHATNITDLSPVRYWKKTLLSGKLSEQSKLTLPVGSDGLSGEMNRLVITGADSADANFTVTGEPSTSGFMDNGTISSNISLGSDYFALALLEHPDEKLLYVPNAFAPFSSKAGREDKVLKVYGKEISPQDFLFRIYNRWGKVVYQTSSYDEASGYGWNGIDENTGEAQGFGAYQYILKGRFTSGKPIDLKGSIYLIR